MLVCTLQVGRLTSTSFLGRVSIGAADTWSCAESEAGASLESVANIVLGFSFRVSGADGFHGKSPLLLNPLVIMVGLFKASSVAAQKIFTAVYFPRVSPGCSPCQQ